MSDETTTPTSGDGSSPEVANQVTDTTEVGEESVDERSASERERDEYRDALQRLQADFENYRKRVVRAADESASRAAGELVVRLLPVLDALDLAVAHFESGTSEELAALIQTRSLLLDTLVREGLERVDAAGFDFDPQVHDAVAHVDGEGDADGRQIVDEVLRAGYRWNGAVLRPAMVRVKG